MSQTLVIIRRDKQTIMEFDCFESARIAAIPFLKKGYVARFLDEMGQTTMTQLFESGQVITYQGDAYESREQYAKLRGSTATSIIAILLAAALAVLLRTVGGTLQLPDTR